VRLIDCFIELIVYVVLVMKYSGETQPDFKSIKEDIDRLLEKSLQLKTEGHFSDRDYNYARMSLSVWIDEAILNSNWEHKRRWQSASLQRRYYNMADGGMEFFDRLDKIGHEERDVREVAYYCLVLGLTGRYVQKGDQAVLDRLKASNLKWLFGSSAGEPSLENRRLFPEAYQKRASSRLPKKRSFSLKVLPLAIGLFSIGLFFVLVVVYYYLLRMDLDKFA
jgi:type IV/VI secretion system ImpK/VasF family protein